MTMAVQPWSCGIWSKGFADRSHLRKGRWGVRYLRLIRSKAHIVMAGMLFDAPSVLVLGEPTNHLDAATKRLL